MVMVPPGSPVPARIGCEASVGTPDVIVPRIRPVSSSSTIAVGAVGGVRSTVRVNTGEAGPVLPAASVARTVIWWVLSFRSTDGVNVHVPLLATTAVPMAIPPS